MSTLHCSSNYWALLIISLCLVSVVSVHVLGEWHFIFKCSNIGERSQDNVVGIVTDFEPDDGGVIVQVLVGSRIFSTLS
jgi:hypothetical protein